MATALGNATQEALIVAWRDLSGLRDPDRFGPWVRRLLVTACYREARRAKRRIHVEARVRALDSDPRNHESAVADREELSYGFSALTSEQRTLIVLHYYLGLPLHETALVMGLPIGTVKSRLSRTTSRCGPRSTRAPAFLSDRPARRERSDDVMTDDALGRPLTSWLEEEAAMRAPDDLLPAVLDRAARTRRRPAWATSERWISMETRAQLGAVPRTAAILAIVALLIILAAATFAAGSGGAQLAPTGPAGNGLIAYDSEGDIWVVDPDGSARRQLTTDPADEHSPTWSRDGTRLAYWSVDPSGSPADLVVIGADGSDPVTVFSDAQGRTPDGGIDWSPDGASIAFALCSDGCGDIFVVASDGTGSSPIGGPDFDVWRLVWKPDGTSLAFAGRYAGGPAGVHVMAPDGSAVRRISQEDGVEGFGSVAWSADGTRLVTHAGPADGGTHIWVIAADGSGDVNLTDREGGHTGGFLPAWSPDDAWVAYRDGSTVYLVPAEGGESRVFGNGEGFAWAPDATALALEGPGGLRILDVETGDTVAQIGDVPGVGSWQRVAP